jgi:hypothetical protein
MVGRDILVASVIMLKEVASTSHFGHNYSGFVLAIRLRTTIQHGRWIAGQFGAFKESAVKIYALDLGISVGLGASVELKLDVKLCTELLGIAGIAGSWGSAGELGGGDKDSLELMFMLFF